MEKYFDVVVTVALLVQGHRLIRIALPLPIYKIFVTVGAWVESHAYAKEDLSVFPELLTEMIVSLPLLPASFDDDTVGNILSCLPDEACLFSGAGAVVLATAL